MGREILMFLRSSKLLSSSRPIFFADNNDTIHFKNTRTLVRILNKIKSAKLKFTKQNLKFWKI
jgi:hypothetical protein